MFRKKKPVVIEETLEDKQIHAYLSERTEHLRTMKKWCQYIILRENAAKMLPDGPDRRIELNEIEQAQKHILNLIAACDELTAKFKQIDQSKLTQYDSVQWMDSHEILHHAWKRAWKELCEKL